MRYHTAADNQLDVKMPREEGGEEGKGFNTVSLVWLSVWLVGWLNSRLDPGLPLFWGFGIST